MAKRKLKPIRPRPTNPVIAGRVPSSLHKKIKRAAKISGRTMSEELAYRVALTFEGEVKGKSDPMMLQRILAGLARLEQAQHAVAGALDRIERTWPKWAADGQGKPLPVYIGPKATER
jgi:hypothetical protein